MKNVIHVYVQWLQILYPGSHRLLYRSDVTRKQLPVLLRKGGWGVSTGTSTIGSIQDFWGLDAASEPIATLPVLA